MNDDSKLTAYTGKVLWEKDDAWAYGVSPPKRQAKLDVYVEALQRLADAGLTTSGVIAHLHQRRVLPLMERRLALHEMKPDAEPEGTQMTKEPLADDVAI